MTRGEAPADLSLPLRRALGRIVPWAEAASAVTAAAADAWGAGSRPGRDEEAAILARATDSSERFRAPAWTWSGAPGG